MPHRASTATRATARTPWRTWATPLADLQERLFADGISGGRRSVLLVLQGMDTSGKGGIVRNAAGLVDPQGLRIKSFKAPTVGGARPRLPLADQQASCRRPG